MKPAVVTLTTDFGSSGSYVASMKGVILSLNPDARLVDVTHEIAPQNIREAALCLWQIVPFFPPDTIHVVVVDPGVGSDRRLLCVRMHTQLFLAPDNGVLSWVARGTNEVEQIVLSEPTFWRPQVSATFHGRDVLAPVAAHLSLGVRPQALGRPAGDCVQIPWPAPEPFDGGLDGEVLAIDRFGNLITNISRSDLRVAGRKVDRVVYADREVAPLVRSYSDVEPGTLAALIGSSALVEIAVRNGSAAERLAAVAGARIRVWFTSTSNRFTMGNR